MLERIRAYFEFDAPGMDFRRKTIAGITTFMTMSCIIVMNRAILRSAGIPAGPSRVAPGLTSVAALLGTTSAGAYVESATGVEVGGRRTCRR